MIQVCTIKNSLFTYALRNPFSQFQEYILNRLGVKWGRWFAVVPGITFGLALCYLLGCLGNWIMGY